MARAHGDGAVYQDRTDPPRWRGAVVIGWRDTPTGRRPVRKYVTGRTKREASDKVRAILRDRDAGRTVFTGTPTVHAWLDHWLTHIAAPTVKPTTLTGYRVAVTRMKAHVPPGLRLDALTVEHFDDLYARMTAAHLAPRTIALQHRAISRALTVAVQRGHLARNPADHAVRPTVREYHGTALTPAQARAVLDTAAARGETARWLLALLTGARQGEILALGWDTVDLDAAVLRIERGLVRVKGEGLVLQSTKSDRRRNVPLPQVIVDALRQHRAAQRETRIRAGSRWVGYRTVIRDSGNPDPVDVPLIFTTRRGTPVSREDDWAAWHNLLAAAGVPPVRLHDARVSTASFLAALGVHPRVAMEILGHTHEAMTAHYTRVPSPLALDALDRLDGLLRDAR